MEAGDGEVPALLSAAEFPSGRQVVITAIFRSMEICSEYSIPALLICIA